MKGEGLSTKFLWTGAIVIITRTSFVGKINNLMYIYNNKKLFLLIILQIFVHLYTSLKFILYFCGHKQILLSKNSRYK